MTDITDSSDDYRGSGNTNGRVSVGGSVQGMLDIDGDVDWFRVPSGRRNHRQTCQRLDGKIGRWDTDTGDRRG